MKKRVRHVITEIARVNSFVRAFANGKIDEAGRLFNALPCNAWANELKVANTAVFDWSGGNDKNAAIPAIRPHGSRKPQRTPARREVR